MKDTFLRDKQYYKFSFYGFVKNLKFFDPFIVLFFKEMGMSFLEIGTLFSIREITTNILEIPTGVVADAYGRRISMIYAFISYIIAFLIFYFFPSFGIYALAMVMFAAGEAFRTGTHKAMILEYLKIKNMLGQKVNYYGHTRSWAQFGSAVSSLIAAGLVFYTGSYKIIFLASVFPYVIGLLLMITYPKELDGVTHHKNGGGALVKTKNKIATTVKDFLALFTSKGILRALFNSSLYDGVFKTVKDYIQPIIQKYALLLPIFISYNKDKRVSLVVGIVYFFLFLLTTFSAASSEKLKRRFKSLERAINITFVFGALLIIGTGVTMQFNLCLYAIILFVFFYMLENLKRPISLAYVSEQISSRVMATGLSGESQLKTIFVAVLAPLMGYLADRIGVGGGITVMAILLLTAFPLVAVRGNDGDS